MARKKVVKRIPTHFENWLACNRLGVVFSGNEAKELYTIIDGFVLDKPIDTQLLMNLRKYWYKVLTMGLTKEQIDELVNK